MLNIQELKKEYSEVNEKLKQAELSSNWKELGELNKKKREIENIIQKQEKLEELEKQIIQSEEIIANEENKELIELAQKDKESLNSQKERTEKEIKTLLSKEDNNEIESVIIEIRAGTGGEEAALFASNLYNMYLRYSNLKNWDLKILDSSRTDIGGLKEITFEIKGAEAYSKLKYEGGVHRVQRIPETEKSGRIHTSAAAVAVLPKLKKRQIILRPEDLRIETFKASGPGGQYVNKRESAIRITHLPTNITVACQSERTQTKNRANALSILEAKIYQKQLESQTQNIQLKRKEQVGRMERSEKIRTYNFPQNRITDHRIKKTWHSLQEVIQGNLNQIIESLEKEIQ